MIKLNHFDDNKQFLLFQIEDEALAADLFHELAWLYPMVSSVLRWLDEQQIVLEVVEGIEYPFSLLEIHERASAICAVTISMFSVETSIKGVQRANIHMIV